MKLLSTKLLSKIYYPNFAKYYDYMTMTNTQNTTIYIDIYISTYDSVSNVSNILLAHAFCSTYDIANTIICFDIKIANTNIYLLNNRTLST